MPRCYDKWSAEETALLRRLLDHYDRTNQQPNWSHISRRIGTKNKIQCYGHYATAIRRPPQAPVERHEWTPIEEQELARLYKSWPFQWERIQPHFPSLTLTQLKNKVNTMKFDGAIDAWAEQAVSADQLAEQLKQLLNGLQ